ncbi:glutamyl-tRNA(Gln) amidotransferase, B subunit [Ectocarpus siliculosus]|uniref:Glutamyl-tRNA(Gln) amidotransferase, B subunit n=1 Tax=Ectocarpus siliculosus TaxID=2880 RepID=D7FYG0_ECTSI|nr:glutamyl-tRNA(Gln) amidotransferase, B subunit [Ectocarpus siliculosus]|eukprot:CBJ32502.1 glutamyl-tRNA(Gln) amidotransferase, B subunit [Ectocarpus siliculosus]
MRSGIEAADYGRELQKVLRYLGVPDGNRAEGFIRLNENVNLRPKGETCLSTMYLAAVMHTQRMHARLVAGLREVIRPTAPARKLLLEAVTVVALQEMELPLSSRGGDGSGGRAVTFEGETGYRYFPEPDIPPLALPAELLQKWRSELCESPVGKRERYQSELGLSEEDAAALSDERSVAFYFEEAVGAGSDPGEFCKWLIGDITGSLNRWRNVSSVCRRMGAAVPVFRKSAGERTR